MKFKRTVFNILEKGSHGSRKYLWFDYAIMAIILLSTTAIILESVMSVESRYGPYLEAFNTFSIIVFTIEYLARIYISDLTYPSGSRLRSAFKFMFSFYGIIDLLAILPFYLPMLIATDLRFLRALRLMRFLRILKVNRYNDSLKIIGEVVQDKKSELGVTVFFAFIVLIIASFLMYYIEGDAQPEAFPNIPSAFWWAIATLTTVGYVMSILLPPWGK